MEQAFSQGVLLMKFRNLSIAALLAAVSPAVFVGMAFAETVTPSTEAAKEWWPAQLDLSALRQNEAHSNPYGGDYNYAKEFSSLDLDAVKADIRKTLTTPPAKARTAAIPNAIRGAASIDKHMRTEGLDWFPDEELSMMQCDGAISMIQQCKPRVVLSHDCPTEVAMEMYGRLIKSRTDQMLQACFLHHQPQLWVFGHHHFSWTKVIGGTKFVCLGELEIMEL